VGSAVIVVTQRRRRHFAERVAVAPRETAKLEESVRHRDVGHGGGPGNGRAQRGAGGLQTLSDDVLLRAGTDDVMKRRAQRAFADACDAAQMRHGHRFAQVVAEEGIDPFDDFRMGHAKGHRGHADTVRSACRERNSVNDVIDAGKNARGLLVLFTVGNE